MDFSDTALKNVSANGHTTLPINADSWEILANTVGFVRCNHVLEHIYNPHELLSNLYRSMTPGGVIHIATPNPEGLSANKYKEFWFGLDCPRHINIITQRTLSTILQNTGFEVIATIPDYHPKDYSRSWASAISSKYKIPLDKMKQLPNNGLLNILFSRQFDPHSNRTVQADRYHIIAKKPLL
jgi:2-polyprenyl-3-methyl-5-hydroxy-6-metoxy-1,4-benzoquinol methylase